MKRYRVLLAILIGLLFGMRIAQLDAGAFLARIPFFSHDRVLFSHPGFWIACVAGWGILGVYWEIAERTAAAAKSAEPWASRGVHVFLTSMAQLMVLIPIRGLGRFAPFLWSTVIPGLALEAAGLFLALWARVHLGKNWSGRITVKVEHELIRSGPYRFLRHPIYTGLLAMYIGPALVTGEWLALAGVVVACVAYWRKIRLEEATLDTAFGADYEAYRRNTWALVPGIY
jgi:protein-S-isoprenylcysteine O-methyltransferase Ste14